MAVGIATITCSNYLDAKAIVAVTRTGRSAQMIADYRPTAPVIAPTVDRKALRQLNLSWGVHPFPADEQPSADSLFRHAEDIALRSGIVEEGDTIVISGGPHEQGSAIDMMRIVKL